MLKISKLTTELISFDLWETLISNKEDLKTQRLRGSNRNKNLYNFFKKEKLNISSLRIKKSLSILSKRCSQDHNRGKDLSFQKRMISFLKILGIKERDFIIALKVGAILDKSFLKYPPKLLPNAFNILKSLSKEYKLCLTSNTGITSPETYLKYLESLKIKNFFDKIYFSNQLEVAKPSIEMFNLILKDFNVEPQKVIHIGDNVFTDMFGAKKAGLKSILINKRKSVTYGFKIIPDNTIADISELSRLKI